MVFKTLIRKETEAMLFVIMFGGRLFASLSPPLGDIADINQNLSKGFLIRLKVKTLILRHPSERCNKKNSDLGPNKLHLLKIVKWIVNILQLNFL